MRGRNPAGVAGLLVASVLVVAPGWLLAQSDAQSHLRRAQQLQQAGKPTEAQAEYEAALRIDPGLEEAQVRLGLLLLEARQTARARRLLEGPAAHATPETLLAIGAACLRSGLLEDAQRHLERAARLAPQLPQVDLLLGQTYSARRLYPAAIERLERAVTREPASPQAHYLLGITHSLAGEKERALSGLEEAVRLAPDNAVFPYYLGLAYLDFGRYLDGARVLERAVALDPRDRSSAKNLAWALINLGRNREAAERLAKVQPPDAVSCFLLGESQRRLGDVDSALVQFGKALELDPRMTDALFARGTLRYLRQEREPARVDYERLLTIDPRHAGGHYQVGKLLIAEGRLEEAAVHLRTCVELEPANKGAHYQLARAYRLQGKAEDARREAALFRSLGTEAQDDAAWRRDPLEGRLPRP